MSKGYLSVFLESSLSTKKLILSLTCLFCMAGSLCLGLPILFKEPAIFCKFHENDSFEKCSEIKACQSLIYEIDYVDGPQSLSTKYNLICDRSVLKKWTLTMNYVGGFTAEICLTIFLISSYYRKLFISMADLILGCSFAAILIFQNSFYIMTAMIFLGSFCCVYINTYSYMFVNETFKGDINGFCIFLFCVVWAAFGMLLAIIGYLSDSNWKVYSFTISVICYCSFMAFIFCKIVKENVPIKDDEAEVEVTFLFVYILFVKSSYG